MVWPAVIAGAAALAGGALGNENNRKSTHEQMDMQREFAQQGIRWKVADARAAGIHPLFALGANTHSPAPIAMQDSLGPALAQGGQDIARAMQSQTTKPERNEANARAFMLAAEAASDQRVMNKMTWEESLRHLRQQTNGQQLQNDLLRLQLIRHARDIERQPGMPGGGNDDPANLTGSVKIKPAEQTSADPDVPGRQALKGAGEPAFRSMRMGGKRFGFNLDVGNSDLSEWLEGQSHAAALLGPAIWAAHYGSRALDSLPSLPERAPPGKKWVRNMRTGNYELVNR